MSESITLSTPDGDMEAFIAQPNDPRGAILVVQEAFGLTDHIKSICERLFAAGYVAIAPALFHRVNSPIFPYDQGFDDIKPVVATLNAHDIDTDLATTFEHLNQEGYSGKQLGILGFCMGGTISYVTGTKRALGAAATFYGGGMQEGRFEYPSLIELAPQLQTPWIGFYGDQDGGIPSSDVEDLRTAIKASSVPTEIYRYADAGHGFNCDARSSYHEASAKDAWQRTLDWFNTHIS